MYQILFHKKKLCFPGQAGHIEVPDSESNNLDGNKELFNLQGQLAHKLDLMINYVDKKSKIHLVGHSIGAWLILELLNINESISKKVSSINLLFPTLQKMAETRNGKFLNKVLRRINIFLVMMFSLVSLLPLWLRLYVIGLYLKFNSLPPHYADRILKYLNPKVGEKVLFLAYDEMDTVTVLNTVALDKIKNLTNVIYSNKDGWAPVHYMDDLRIFQPHLQMIEVDIDHAFVLKSSEQVAEMVSNFIKVKQN